MSKPWTDKEIEIFKTLIEKNFTSTIIATVLKSRSKRALKDKASELGLQLPDNKVDIDFDAFKQLIKQKTRKI